MPRKVRDSALETRTARGRLAVAHKPYFRLIEPGLHLGYRKLPSGPGTWIARRYNGNGKYVVENLRTRDGLLVVADDFDDADGTRILTFAQAQRAAKGPRATRAAGGLTVSDIIGDYLDHLRSDGRSLHAVDDATRRAGAHILPTLGTVKVATLTSDKLRHWRDGIARGAPRLRTRPGERQKYRKVADDEDSRRARRSTANRTWTVLRAALNHAFTEGKIEQDVAWRKVRPFRSVDAARVRYLSVAEAKRLINASDVEFRSLVQAALQTGCRYGELTRLRVADFNSDAGTLAIRQSKSGRPRHIVLTDEGATLFAAFTVGRDGHDLILPKANGEPWRASHQGRPMRAACERAKIKPAVSFHALRHTWASHAVMNGMPLLVVAKNLGHSDTRMVEKHYGHLAPSYIADAIRAGAPRFGIEMDTRVAPIRGRR
jgi:integrase